MAMRAAVEERGVAVVVIPGEVFLQRADESAWTAGRSSPPVRWSVPTTSRCSGRRTFSTTPRPSRSSPAPVSRAVHDAVIAAAATLNAPIVHALRGKEFIEYDNPYDVGMTGLLGFASGYKAIKEADALLMLGTDFPYQQFYPDHAKVIQVDIRGRNLGRRTPIELRAGRHRARHTRGPAALACGRSSSATTSTGRSTTTARPESGSTSWRSTIATAPRSDPNTLRGW